MALDDTICIAPLESSLHSLMPVFLSSVPGLIASISSFRLAIFCFMLVMNSLIAPLLSGLYAVERLGPLWRTDSSGWMTASCWHKKNCVCLTHLLQLWYLRCRGLLEEDVKEKEQMSWGVEQSWMVWGKGGREINPICRCNQYRCWQRECWPSRTYEHRLSLWARLRSWCSPLS